MDIGCVGPQGPTAHAGFRSITGPTCSLVHHRCKRIHDGDELGNAVCPGQFTACSHDLLDTLDRRDAIRTCLRRHMRLANDTRIGIRDAIFGLD